MTQQQNSIIIAPMRQFLFSFLLCSLFSVNVRAQDINRDAFQETLKLVDSLGAMRDSSLKSIVNAVTVHCGSEACSMYAMYMWVVKNITRDCKHPQRQNNTASYVLANREANSEGFANLIAEMCKLVHIPCEVVNGLAKQDVEDIGHVDNEANLAYWNTVVIGKKRYLLDASLGGGDCQGKRLNKQLTDAWFLSNRRLFALSHFPHDKQNQLLDTPVERSEFVAAPIVKPIANVIALVPPSGTRGLLRGRAEDTIKITFSVVPTSNIERIGSASISADGNKPTPALLVKGSSTVTVGIPLPKEGEYPLLLLMDNYPAFYFQVKASAAPKKRAAQH